MSRRQIHDIDQTEHSEGVNAIGAPTNPRRSPAPAEPFPRFESVLKRDGTEDRFDAGKINQSIRRAAAHCNRTGELDIERLTREALALLHRHWPSRSTPSTLDIQDVVEKTLVEHQEPRLARAYILFRVKTIEETAMRKIHDHLVERIHASYHEPHPENQVRWDPRHPRLQNRIERSTGLVQVYTGDGKGKTTASMGLAMRAMGHNHRVIMIQFLKGGSYIGELEMADRLSPFLHIVQFGINCLFPDEWKSGQREECGSCRYCFLPAQIDQPQSRYALERSLRAVASGFYDLVILDEINVAAAFGLVKTQDVLNILHAKTPQTEIVLTGQGAPPEVIDAADLVTEMRPIKHYMEKGVPGRRGIEF